MKKIEINILITIIIEAMFLLYFFKINYLSILLGIIIGIIFIQLTKTIKFNNIFLSIILIPFYILTIYKITLFTKNNLLNNYSTLIIVLSLLALSFYLVKKGYHVFIKTTEILFYFIIFIKIILFIMCLPLINFNNFNFYFKLDYRLIYIALFIFLLDKLLFNLTNYNCKNKNILLAFINPLYIKTMSLLILGDILTNLYQYPYVNYIKKISYFDFIERIDGILNFEYLFCFIILLSFILINIKKIKKST